MSVSKYAYDPAMCDGDICVGDCDLCDKPKIAQIHNTAASTTRLREEINTTDYIKREDINKLLNDLSFATRTVTYNSMTGHTLEDILEHDFSELPSADVRENVKAMYIFDTHYGEWRCSNCGIVFEDYADEPPYNFCPNCGADMRGES